MKHILYLVLVLLLARAPVVSAQSEEKPRYAPGKEKHRNKTDELDRKQGTWMFYNGFGEKTTETEYVNDKKEGQEKKYFSYERIREETEYLAGIKEGAYTRYYFSGQVAEEGQYLNGK